MEQCSGYSQPCQESSGAGAEGTLCWDEELEAARDVCLLEEVVVSLKHLSYAEKAWRIWKSGVNVILR